MKFTLGWLKQHLDTTASLSEITDKLTAIGLEVEDMHDPAALYAPFRVALIEKAEKHPDADRLKVCIVDTGTEKLQVVCGAPNARTGMKGVFAPAGSYVPGTGVELKKGMIRGQESNGMMVSEREMGLSDAHEGIIEVSDDLPLGTPFSNVYGLDDPVIEINLTPNRADCAGIRGIARDLAAAGLGTLKALDETPVAGTFDSPVGVTLDFAADAASACPLFLGRYIRNVKNSAAPASVQKRLKAVGLRPISALVDITNYLSLDLCRPLHVFDADKLKGAVHVRLARKGEALEALDGKTYALEDFMTVICDDSGVIALAGVIGGMATGCTEDTKNVFLEVAYFDPARIAKTGRALQINSDARYRFERGIDPAFTVPATDIATRMILDLCGGEVSHVVQAGKIPAWERKIPFDSAHVQKLTGLTLDAAQQKTILQTLGFVMNADDTVTPPSWRADVEGKADLVEEIIRIYGLDNLPSLSLRNDSAITHSAETPLVNSKRKARTALAARGLNESVTWSFLPSARAQLFGAAADDTSGLRLVNPISSELDHMRPSILPNLIEAVGKNRARGFPDVALFEVGPIFLTPKPDGQTIVATGIRSSQSARHWSGQAASRPADVFDAKADALAVLRACNGPADTAQITRDAPSWYHPGRSGAVKLGTNVLAYFGEIHPAILDEMDVKGPVVGFEVFLERIPQARKKDGSARPLLKLSPFQPLARDFAFIVDQDIDADALVRAIRNTDRTLITHVDVFDVFSGKTIADGKKSIALSVTIQPVAQTLTDEDIETLSQKIVANVSGKTGATLRG